jgi:hypothetical protein
LAVTDGFQVKGVEEEDLRYGFVMCQKDNFVQVVMMMMMMKMMMMMMMMMITSTMVCMRHTYRHDMLQGCRYFDAKVNILEYARRAAARFYCCHLI